MKIQICKLMFAAPLVLALPSLAKAATNTLHRWEYIQYPYLPCEWGQKQASVSVGYGDKSHGFRFDITLFSEPLDDPAAGGEPHILSTPSAPEVRLHTKDGRMIDPQNKKPRPLGIGRAMGSQWSFTYVFPWGSNVLQEVWIETKLPKQTYWLEVPYGFYRDPQQLLAPPDKAGGRPVPALAMKQLAKADRIVPWLAVQYDLGVIQNGWRLSLRQSNPFDAECELELYTEENRKGLKTWDLHSPRTSLTIHDAEGYPLTSTCMSIRRHEDGMRRSDTFKFNRYPVSGRSWGTLNVTVDKETHSIVVPSSLYKYVHGLAEPYHKRLVPRERK